MSQEVPPSMVGAGNRNAQRVISKEKIIARVGIAPHLGLLQVPRKSQCNEIFEVKKTVKEPVLPSHRDDIFAFLKSYVDKPEAFSSPAVMS